MQKAFLKLRILFFTWAFFCSIFASAQEVPPISDQEWKEVNEIIAKEHVEQDPSLHNKYDFLNFYDRTLRDGEFAQFNSSEGPLKNDEHFIGLIKNSPEKIIEGNPWIFAKYPSYDVRKLGYERLMKLEFSETIQYDERTQKLLNGKKERIKFLKNPDSKITLLSPKELPKEASEVDAPADFNRVKNSKMLKWGACLKFSPLEARKCSEALDHIMEIMKPDMSRRRIAAFALVHKIIESPEYAEGASRAAIKIMNKVDQVAANPKMVVGDLFTDIYESYREVGYSAARANELTWDVLGLYASRGANIKNLLPFASGKVGSRTLIAIESIGSGLSVLDAVSYQSGHLYSIPKQLYATANYGKPYHFWMSAYLSREAMIKTGSEAAARGATVISEVGYQMLSTTVGRDEFFKTVLSKGPFSAEANKIRVDLAFAFAGAEYGARHVKNGSTQAMINVDDVVKQMLKKTPNLKAWSVAEIDRAMKSPIKKVKAYARWMRMIQPSSGARLVSKSQDCISFLSQLINSK